MKHLILILCALTCITPKNHADNKNLQLHYNRPADYFEETLVIGNGTLGATIYGGTQQEKIQLNDITLWTGEPEKEITSPDAHKYIPAIRKRLFAEDYRGVNDDLRQVQGHYSQNY
jgi:alpha-L-fucosidase 2